MKDLLDRAAGRLRPQGYQRRGSSFWKIERDVYRLVDFQAGIHGEYFFVNVCLHPVGLPRLLAGRLSIPESPKEHEGVIRRRIEEVVPGEATAAFSRGLVTPRDTEAVDAMLAALPMEVVTWLDEWGDLRRLAGAPESEIVGMLTAAPTLREKAYRMLVFYCSVKAGFVDRGPELFRRYKACSVGCVDLQPVDEYLRSLLG